MNKIRLKTLNTNGTEKSKQTEATECKINNRLKPMKFKNKPLMRRALPFSELNVN